MHEESVFSGPLQEPWFLSSSEPLPTRGVRTRGALRLGVSIFLATGLTATAVSLSDGAATSHEATRVGVAIGTEHVAIETAGLPEEVILAASWANYRKKLNGVIPGPFAGRVRKLWSDLERETSCPIPHAGPTPQGSFIMSWDRDRHHLEVELFAEGRHEWFYCDRKTDFHEGSEGNRRQAVAAVASYLERFA